MLYRYEDTADWPGEFVKFAEGLEHIETGWPYHLAVSEKGQYGELLDVILIWF